MMRLKKNIIGGVLLLLCLNLIACSGSLFRNYGRILPSDEITQDMEGGVYRPEIRYYVSGSDAYPNALMGLHRDYRLDPQTLWKEVAMTPGKLREIIGSMKAKAYEYANFLYGYDLIDTKNKKIGFWYSILTASTYLRFLEDGTVMVATPDLDTYEKLRSEVEIDADGK